MKKLYILAITLLGFTALHAQGFGIGVSGAYLTELDGAGGSADLIYELDEKWGLSTSFTYAVKDDTGVRAKWTILDLNARYKVFDELYLMAGGQYLDVSLKQLGLGGGDPIAGGQFSEDSQYGANAGLGYKYNLLDNVNIFAEVKYAFVDSGYLHSKLGLRFDF